jgi:hypothetical protein
VQRAFVGAADIHARLLADGLQALQLAQFIGVVVGGGGVGFSESGGFFGVGHLGRKWVEKMSWKSRAPTRVFSRFSELFSA